MPPGLDVETRVEDALTLLRAMTLADVALQDALGDIESFKIFAVRAAEAALARGFDLEAETVEELLYAPPSPIPVLDDVRPPPGWLPAEVTRIDGRATVTWIRFGRRRLIDSFYDDSLIQARRLPFNRLLSFRTPLKDLTAWAAGLPPTRPDGLIFHMSRCGSTLTAQMLAAAHANTVLSEAAPLRAIVRMAELDDDDKVILLRAMTTALGQARNGETRLFLKLDCWHSLDLPLFRRAFPETPWVFLYREPVEVMVSHVRRRGMQMAPSLVPPETFGIDLPDGVPNEDYCARVLAAICEGALRPPPAGGGRLVNYRDLPQALFTTILPHFGVEASSAEITALHGASLRDAKTPEQAFTPDAEAKQQAATAAVRDICERRLADLYRRLEALRGQDLIS